ncbi:acetate--CoA ligase [Halovibrio salipaludis]|uniref:Acetyl-coenzyme A synthetase n=1 Tax=Halovibrio salipaludis TaxID=2032626 RepID=A0A2A2FBR0_9GAMM|nr:acetate--CoA ligase [Halovibrio salipaludis]PAU82408.1 acetate--CoA ligase [Halovibrio salipaludis]
MSDEAVYPVTDHFRNKALIDKETYESMYQRSIQDPESFWAEQAKRLDWMKPFSRVKDVSFASDDVHIRWFDDGTLNAAANCIDRHLEERSGQPAIIWEPDEESEDNRVITYAELHEEVSRLANGLKSLGVKKGDIVTLYMPMVPEAAYAMLACARIGAIHSVVFGGFSPEALAGRIDDGGSKVVITADEARRGGKRVPLKANVDEAVSLCKESSVDNVVVLKATGGNVDFNGNRDIWYRDLVGKQSDQCEPEEMGAEDTLFVLYTSGSTGKPKGVVHTTGGYLLHTSITHEYVFDYRPGEVYWCSADVGWITGHSYVVYGPLANGGTTMMFEGVPTYPDVGRLGRIIDKYKIATFYTAPTAIRSLMAEGDAPVANADLSSLKLLGTVGEPINPEAWRWFHQKFGKGQCPIVDTWWQTETGGILISPLPGAIDLKPGSATKPFFGVQPALMDPEGNEMEGATSGGLVLKDSWPGQMRTILGNHQRFVETYFSTYEGCYFTGDGAKRDEDGYYWITGRVDDVLNVSGHRMGTAEVESALVSHDAVAEAAVVGCPHEIKGQGIYVYVTLTHGQSPSDELAKELKQHVRKEIGPIATPDVIQWADGLPKTRSGKIMRRILRKIAADEFDSLGDTSTLADPNVVDDLIEGHRVAAGSNQ